MKKKKMTKKQREEKKTKIITYIASVFWIVVPLGGIFVSVDSYKVCKSGGMVEMPIGFPSRYGRGRYRLMEGQECMMRNIWYLLLSIFVLILACFIFYVIINVFSNKKRRK